MQTCSLEWWMSHTALICFLEVTWRVSNVVIEAYSVLLLQYFLTAQQMASAKRLIYNITIYFKRT